MALSWLNPDLKSTIIQLETRPPGRNNRFLPTKMESVSGISKPTMEINHSSTVRSPVPEGQSDLDSSSMKTQVWYPTLLSLLVGYPYHLPIHREVVCQVHPLPSSFQGNTVQLAAWPILGKADKRKNFLSKLQAWSWHHGDLSQTQTTSHSFTSGSAGVIQRIEVPFWSYIL